MVTPKEIVVPIDDLPSIGKQGFSPSGIQTTSNESRLRSYIPLIISCAAATGGGFIAVRSFFILVLFAIGRKRFFHSNVADTTDARSSLLGTPLGLVFVLVFGLLATAGFTFAAVKRLEVITLNTQSEVLRNDLARLLGEQQRLLLAREQELSPAVLETRARALGMVNVTPAMVWQLKTSNSSSVADRSLSVLNKAPLSKDISLLQSSSAVQKAILPVMALLGGFIALLTLMPSLGELLTRMGRHSPRIDPAPGSRHLLIVDFLFSPKDMEQIFKPIVADWRTEYFEALNQKRTWKARWVSVRYSYSFVASMGLRRIFSFIRSLTRVRW
jgi:hypothetical protein